MKHDRRVIGLLLLFALLLSACGTTQQLARSQRSGTRVAAESFLSPEATAEVQTAPSMPQETAQPVPEPTPEPVPEPTSAPTPEVSPVQTEPPVQASVEASDPAPEEKPAPDAADEDIVVRSGPTACDYIANTNTGKFHYPDCSSVGKMKESNKLYFNGTRTELVALGYDPCKICCP